MQQNSATFWIVIVILGLDVLELSGKYGESAPAVPPRAADSSVDIVHF